MTPSFFQKALEIAARITDPTAAAAFGVVIACVALWIAFKKKDKKVVLVIGIILGVGIIFLGALPLLAKTYLNAHGVYEIRVMVLEPNGSPAEDAVVFCASGEQKRIAGGWECDVPPKNRPGDGIFIVDASLKSAFLFGRGQLKLGDDYDPPPLRIQLQAPVSATLGGEILGKQGRVLAGAWVSVVGHASERVQSDPGGGFTLPAHAAQGQMIRMHVEAAGYGAYEGLQQAGDESISIQLTK